MTNENIGSEAKTWMLDDPYSSDIEYTRTDLHQAELAAVIEVVRCLEQQLTERGFDGYACGATKITSPPDATAALEKVKREAWNEAMDEVADTIEGEYFEEGIADKIRALKREVE